MPFNAENVLFGASWDNKDFIEGVNEQIGGFKKLEAEAANYEKSLDEVTGAIRANEFETVALTKRNNELKLRIEAVNTELNELKTQFRGGSTEAKKLEKELIVLNKEQRNVQAAIRGTATSTKEFRLEQTALRGSLAQTNTALKVHAAETRAATAAQGGFGKSLGGAFGALRNIANIIPGLGISGIFLLGFEALTSLLAGLDLFSSKLTEAEERQSLFNDVMKEANEDAGEQIATVKILTQAAQDQTLSMDVRLRAVKELQKQFPEYFGQLTQEAILTGNIKTETDALTASIIAAARARAAKGKIDELEAQRLDIEFEKQKIRNATDNETIRARKTEVNLPTNVLGITSEQAKKETIATINQRRVLALNDQDEKDAALKRQVDFLTKFVGLGNLVPPPPPGTSQKELQDAYKKALQNSYELKKLLLEDEIKTQQAIAASNILYTERAAAAQRAADLENDLAFLTFEYQQKLGKDELLNEAQTAIAIKNINIKLNQDLQKIFADRAKFASSEAIVAPAEARSAELQAAARKRVEDAINNQIRAAGADRQNIISANESLEIQTLNEQRARGLVSETQYQERIKEIKDKFNRQALLATIQNLERQLKELDQFANGSEFAAIDAKLQKAKADLTTLDTASETKLASFLDNVLTIENAIVGLYQSINEAEQESLNRSIALQQQRVNNARFIAERGNAEYLALEQKRLDELVRRQEAAAERQIAIANAVSVAQALVAIIKSIAEAPPGIGFILAAQTIALIAAGYKFVSSLQPVSTSFYEGTPYVERGKHKAGKDTIPARVNIGEAIIPTDTNAKYKDSVMAIYNKTIPPNVLNDFVNSYPHNRVPTTDFARLGTATDYKMSEVTETNKKLDKVYEVLTSIDAGLLGASPVDIRMDRDGFYVGWHEYVKKQKIRRKA